MNIKKKIAVIVAVSFIMACFFGNAAVAGASQLAGKEVDKTKPGKRTEGKKKRPVIMGGMEKRKAALKATFRRAGISREDVDNILSDRRLELYHSIYAPPVLKEGGKKKLSYFDEEFGLFKTESIGAGKKMMADNKELLAQIENIYGVPANYIVAIVRIETNFKEHLGKYGVFNALYTMAMLDKRVKRVEMAHRELVAWIKICRRSGLDPYAIKGSWAGAFGIPQFMPSSYVVFAVDYNGDGKPDLYDYPDAFASIANYLRHMGWKTGDRRRMHRAVYSYNHEIAYVNAVLAYAARL